VRYSVIVLLIGMLIISCGKEAEESSTNQASEAAALDLAQQAKDELLCQAGGDVLIQQFGGALKFELKKALGEGGHEYAIETCAKKAPEIAAASSREGMVSIKRVSDRFRNGENEANDQELETLRFFEDLPRGSELIRGFWEDREDGQWYVYHKAIKMELVCMRCHGAPGNLAPGVEETLAGMYPDDKAVGYKPGDIRGLFVVDAKWPEARDYLDSLRGTL